MNSTIALIDQTNRIGNVHLSAVAAAVQMQLNRDVMPIWKLGGTTVTTLPNGATVPLDVFPIYIVDHLPPGEGGYHWDTSRNQPYAVVANGPGWTVAVSHEAIEMSIDPHGNRLHGARSIEVVNGVPALGNAQAYYLVEPCDACESHGYPINGVALSDFQTPAFYQDGNVGPYDFMGRLKAPLLIIPGGYISWVDPITKSMMQMVWLDPNQPPEIRDLGPSTMSSWKEHVDGKTGAVARISASADHPAVVLAQSMAGAQAP